MIVIKVLFHSTSVYWTPALNQTLSWVDTREGCMSTQKRTQGAYILITANIYQDLSMYQALWETLYVIISFNLQVNSKACIINISVYG